MLAKGDRVGRYVVDAAVGSHGGVDVYRGHDPQLDRAVAVKLLPGTNQRFHREARATALLNHPNIVATLDVFDHDGRPCIVREWVDTSLEAVLAEKPSLGLEETLRVGRDVAAALVHAHARGVLHRDIKPANVLLTAMGPTSWSTSGPRACCNRKRQQQPPARSPGHPSTGPGRRLVRLGLGGADCAWPAGGARGSDRGTTLAMVHEFETGTQSADRQSALLNIVALMEKIQGRLAPPRRRRHDGDRRGLLDRPRQRGERLHQVALPDGPRPQHHQGR